MNWLATGMRGFAKWQFRIRGLASITDIPTEKFNELILALQNDGWKKTYEYSGFDAWIDYGCVRLKKNGDRLKFEWDNWDEGSIEGPANVVKLVADRFGFQTSPEWRWSSWDRPKSRR